jgi:formate-dependent nitrite reductase membrane component NrfD
MSVGPEDGHERARPDLGANQRAPERRAGARPDLGATRPARPDEARPVIKEPVWTPEIPLYFYTGGLAGASAGLGLLASLRDERRLAARAWSLALAGSVVSPALLISDLGVPRRFLYMLRMFKVTSPMSVGSWILAGFGAATAPAAAHALTDGRLGAAGRASQFAAALLGLPLSTYTAALIANTAVPAWHEARFELPVLFAAGAAASAGAACSAITPVADAQPARRLAVGGAAVEIAIALGMERRLRVRGVGEAYREATVARLSHAATAATLSGAALLAARGSRSRRAAVAGGALVSAGAVAERWTVFLAGRRSAARAEDTVGPQRARIQSGAARGAARLQARPGAALTE